MKQKTKRILAILILAVVSLAAATALYAGDYYRAGDVAASLADSDGVAVSAVDEGYFFDGPGEENALIFYPGAKVEETAYAPLLHSLAAQGVDCFLIKMPLRLAIFGMNRADKIRSEYPYERYYLAGHSLGGAMAANHAAGHPTDYAGLFLLAAYPSKDMTAVSFPVMFIYGENDNVLNREKLEEGFALSPPDYTVTKIAGGNHAGFGVYGAQDGDGKATVSSSEQQHITTAAILSIIQTGKDG